jgi:hypothetical protein
MKTDPSSSAAGATAPSSAKCRENPHRSHEHGAPVKEKIDNSYHALFIDIHTERQTTISKQSILRCQK